MTRVDALEELGNRLAAWTRAALEAGVPPLVILEAGRAALDRELGPCIERIHEASEAIDGTSLCVRCGTDLPAPPGMQWNVSTLVSEVWRWGEPIRTMTGDRVFIAYDPVTGIVPEWCAFAMGAGE